MIDSAGILFICNGRCLLAHSTNARKLGSWMPPKGHLEADETPERAAIRETEEEIGWKLQRVFLTTHFDVSYTDRKGRVYKTVRIFPVHLESEKPEENGPAIKVTGPLQIDEVDEIRWFTREEINRFALPRYVEPIKNALK